MGGIRLYMCERSSIHRNVQMLQLTDEHEFFLREKSSNAGDDNLGKIVFTG